jgi:deoxyribonuclease-1-like protein
MVAELYRIPSAPLDAHARQDHLLMFGIRRRWPLTAAAAAAVIYVLNNYSISGIEHLKIKPVGGIGAVAPADFSTHAAAGTEQASFDLAQFNLQSPASPAGQSWEAVAQSSPHTKSAWEHFLNAGEKLTVWQGKLGANAPQDSGKPGAFPGPSLSVSSPIPAPIGLSPPNIGGSNSTGLNALPDALPDKNSFNPPPIESPLLIPVGSNPRPISPASDVSTLTTGTSNGTVARPFGEATIRVATFKVPAMGPATLAKPHTLQTLVSILRHFDLVALQGIQTARDDVLPLLVEQLNVAGGSYDYLIGPRVGRSTNRQQFAILFDTRKLETDRYQLYTVDDPQDLVMFEPLVAWFRCKGVPPQDAFTFSIVDLAVEPSFADAERSLLPNMITAIENDGRNEDDWILAGDFAGGPAELTILESSRARFAVRDMPTDVAGSQTLDSIVFSSQATGEFTGRAGVFDFLRKYNLSIERAMEVSSRLPVWAEFSCLEGAQPGRVAPHDPQAVY